MTVKPQNSKVERSGPKTVKKLSLNLTSMVQNQQYDQNISQPIRIDFSPELQYD
jgi:hypothetical protein